MNPNTFLKTFWRMELKPQVFVAMTFAPQYQERYEQVIIPAVRSLFVNNVRMEPYRVDISKSGDSILTDISDGIAHSQLILADISTVGKDSVTGIGYRNGNVMYEVGLALACRHPSEVLLVRDDRDKFLFDVSTVPHLTLDFTSIGDTRQRLSEELSKRLREQRFINDARVQLAIAHLTGEEVKLLRDMKEYTPKTVWGREVSGIANWYGVAMSRLLDKELIRVVGEFPEDKPAFAFTPLGYVVQQKVKSGLRKFEPDKKPEEVQKKQEEGKNAQPSLPADTAKTVG